MPERRRQSARVVAVAVGITAVWQLSNAVRSFGSGRLASVVASLCCLGLAAAIWVWRSASAASTVIACPGSQPLHGPSEASPPSRLQTVVVWSIRGLATALTALAAVASGVSGASYDMQAGAVLIALVALLACAAMPTVFAGSGRRRPGEPTKGQRT